jgi:hypothetical protein
VPAGTTLGRLVDEFIATLSQHGIAVDRQTVEQEMRDRIADIAERLRTDPQTVLREHASRSWARQMATDVIAQVQKSRLLVPAGPRDNRSAPLAG